MSIDTNAPTSAARTVADIVIAAPGTARVFERFGIDYCCHGQRPLAEACLDAGVDEHEVEAALGAVTSSPGEPAGAVIAPTAPTIGGLIDHIVSRHHVWLRRELPRLEELFIKVLAAHGANHPELQQTVATFRALVDDLLPHLMKEERVLFPLTIELLGAVEQPRFHCGSVNNPISVMLHEHDAVGELLATLRRQTGAYTTPEDACPTWRALWAGLAELEADTHEHIHLENNVLFPKIVALEASLA